MKTTVNVSLNGRAFIVEEDAYNTLRNYLDDIKSRLESGETEIISDIESRISELLYSKLGITNQVVNIFMVQNVIDVIGAPHYFGESKSNNTGSSVPPPRSKIKFRKEDIRHRLMRDDERAILGGVCAGMASYLGTDISLVRIIAIVISFCFGFGIIPYIILWIVIPKAVTTEDKEMIINGYNK